MSFYFPPQYFIDGTENYSLPSVVFLCFSDSFCQFRICSLNDNLTCPLLLTLLTMKRFETSQSVVVGVFKCFENLCGKVANDYGTNFRRPTFFAQKLLAKINWKRRKFLGKLSNSTSISAMRIWWLPMLVELVRNQSFLMPY